jgi:predicted branched-subunit amino acid permease
VILPFGLLFGVVATEAGLNLAQTMGLTMLVIAGAAQFTAVQLLSENAPVFVILAASLGVNLRTAMYSASLVPHLGAAPFWQRALAGYFTFDQNYAAALTEYDARPEMGLGEKMGYYLGLTLFIVPMWYFGTWVGAVAGAAIPPDYALDFALPLMFIALIAPAIRTLPHVVAAVVAVVVALLSAGLPAGFGVLLAGAAGMVAGAETERRLEQRA